MLAFLQTAADSNLSYGWELVRAFLALGGVLLVAWICLRWLSQRGFSAHRTGTIRVLEKTMLDPKRALFLVRVGDRVFLVGSGESGPPSLLSEVDPETLSTVSAPDRTPAARLPSFREVVGKLGAKK